MNIFVLIFSGTSQITDTPSLFIFRILKGVVAGILMKFIPTYIN